LRPPESALAPPAATDITSLSRRQFWRFIREKGLFGGKAGKEGEGKKDGEKPADKDAKKGQEDRPKKGLLHCLSRYVREMKGQYGRVALLLVTGLLDVFLRAALPWASKFMIDFVLPTADVILLAAACGMLAVIGLSQLGISVVEDYSSRAVTGNLTAMMKRRVMRHLQRVSLARVQQLKVGGIVARLEADTEGMSQLLFTGLLTPLKAGLILVVGLGSLFALSWKVALICLVFASLIVICSYTYFNVMRPFQRRLREEQAQIQGRATEVFSGAAVVRAFRQERRESHIFTTATHLLWRKGLYASVLGMALHRSVAGIYWFLNIAIWLTGGYYAMRGEISVGDLVAFIAFVEWLFGPVFMIMHSLADMQKNLACAERTFDLLDEPSATPDRPGAVEAAGLAREVRFENVVFDYPDGTRALRGVNLVIPAGKVTALVGPSGAGKTTVTSLVMRFYDATEGRITLDGTDIREIKLESYRRLISLVLQDVFLFDGTVRENIAYGKPDATAAEVEEAARVSHCHEFVSKLEKGYDTMIGERGVKLSGGQKQRIALARAVLVKPRLLILDEATSFLDSESESLVQDALRRIFATCTTLVIAHRLSTIMDADKIVVLDKGEVVEEGRHGELLAKGGRYAQMYSKQMEKAERHKTMLTWEDDALERAEASNGAARTKPEGGR